LLDAILWQGLQMEGLCDRYAARRRNSKSDNKFKIEEVEDELEEMVTLASSSLRLHNECSAEIVRLTKVRTTYTCETGRLIRALNWNLTLQLWRKVMCALVFLLCHPSGNLFLLIYWRRAALQILKIDFDECGIPAVHLHDVDAASPFLRACEDM